jgi:hypothetical protein
MMDEEEAGMQGNWQFSSEYEDSGSECSSLIAAGRDVCDVEEEQQTPPAARRKPVLPPLRSFAAQGALSSSNTSSSVPACCNADSRVHGSSDTLSPGDFNGRLQLCGEQCSGSPVAATPPACVQPIIAALAAVPDAAAATAGAMIENTGTSVSVREDVCIEDAVGLHEELGQEHEQQKALGGGCMFGDR